jgi:hypothetical protein
MARAFKSLLNSFNPEREEHIMVFRHFTLDSVGRGAIYVRPFFRKQEPRAFEKIYNFLSGWVPPAS